MPSLSSINALNALDYEYDIFISYRRSDEDWIRWTREIFLRSLSSLLRPSLGRIRIAFDEDLEVGTQWPISLAKKLSLSKLMVPILSRDYFESDWCKLEIALMLHREQSCGLRTPSTPCGLVIPVVIDDGSCFPVEVQVIQSQKIHDFANPFMRIDSPSQEIFADTLRKKLCVDIQAAIATVPAFDPKWYTLSVHNFQERFQIAVSSAVNLPSITLPRSP